MKIKLDVYSELTILEVSEQITKKGVEVILAGLAKQTLPTTQWIVINILNAQPLPEAIEAYLEVKNAPPGTHPDIDKVVLVSSLNGIADFGSLEAALLNCPSKETDLAIQKARLESERDHLKQNHAEIEARIASQTQQKTRNLISPFHLHTYLTRLQEILKNEIKKLMARIQAFQSGSPASVDDSQKTLNALEAKMLKDLENNKTPSSTQGGQ